MSVPASLAANPRLDRWVGFETPGLARVAIGKVEYGQGALTGLAQIAAEELDVRMDQVDLVNPETDRSPDEGLTVGSMTTESSGAAIRFACAEARALFTAAAARRLGCPPAALDVVDGAFVQDGEPSGLDYWALAGEVDLAVPPTGEAAAKSPHRHRIVGQSAARLDLPAKVFGAAYLHDLAPAGMLHARVLRQPGPTAKLASLDEAAIRRAAGAPIEILREKQFVAFLGESEAAVVAAVNAAEQTAGWDGARDLSPALSETTSLKELPCESFPSPVPPRGAVQPPPPHRRLQPPLHRPRLDGPLLRPGVYDGDELTVWTHAQGVYPMRMLLARVCGLAPAKIKVVHTQGAGTYGHNGSDDATIDAAVIAVRKPGKPIRVLWRREDEFGHEPLGTAMHIELTAELDAGGRIADYGTEIWSGSHTGGRGRCLAETALELPPGPPMVPPTLSGWRALLRRRPQRDPVVRHRGEAGDRARGAGAGAHLVAARPRRAGEHLRQRVLRRRTGRAGRPGPGRVPPRPRHRSEGASGDRDDRGDGRMGGSRRGGDGQGARLRLLPLSGPRRLRRRRRGAQRRHRGAARPHVVRHRLRPGDQSRRLQEPARGRHDHGRQLGAEGAGAAGRARASSPPPGTTIRSCASTRSRRSMSS